MDHSKTQCSSDGDCLSRGPAFEGTFCDLNNHVCADSLAYCRTNAECIDRNGGNPFVCHKDTHTCSAVLSVDCQKLYAEPDDLRSDDTVIIGADLNPTFHDAAKAADLTVELARREFKNVGFLPGINGGPRRHVAFLSCDTPPPRTDDQSKATAHHLVDDVRVMGIIAPLESDRVAAFLQVTIPAGIPVITPIGNSSTMDNIPGRANFFYEVPPTDTFLLGRGVHMIDQFVEPKLRAMVPPPIPDGTPFKVAVLKDSTVQGGSAEKAYFDNAKVNGKSLSDNFVDGNYQSFSIGDPAAPNFPSTMATAVQQIVTFAPNFILVGGTAGGTAQAVPLIENNWTATYKPYWMSNDTIVFDAVTNQVKKDPTFGPRFFVIAFGPDPAYPQLVAYDIDYDGVFGSDQEATRTILSSATYDATYLTFYALASLGNTPPTPAALGLAYKKVADPNGKPVAVGPDLLLNQGLDALSHGQTIQLDGTWGPPTFDDLGRNIAGETPIYCFDPSTSPPIVPSGIKFDRNNKLVIPATQKKPCAF